MTPIETTDFIGRYAVTLPFDNSEDKLQECIDRYQDYYLIQLLGAEMFNDGVPSEIENAMSFDWRCDTFQSRGLKDMLLSFIWSHYNYDNVVMSNSTGNSTASQEAGKQVDASGCVSMFNQGVETYRAIQAFIEKNIGDYPLYKGNLLRYKSWF